MKINTTKTFCIMKKIIIALLLSSGFMMAQTKSVVTKFGEIVNIHPFVNNGLTATNGYIQLGGALTKPSVLTTTSSFTLAFSGLQTGLGTDNVLVTDASSGVLKMISASAFTPYYWGVKGNSGTDPDNNFIGTTDSRDLIFKTSGAERLRLAANGFLGVGLSQVTAYGTTPKYALDVANDIHIYSNRVNYTSGRLIFENQQIDWGGAQGSGTYLLDGQDNGSRREWFFGKPYDNVGTGAKSSFVLKSMQTDALNYSLAQNGVGAYHLYVDGINNRIGIGTVNPSTSLEVSSTTTSLNPLKLNGLQTGASTDQMLTVDNNGVVRKMPIIKGRVSCANAVSQVINDANVTSTATISLTYETPSNGSVISVALGTRTAGSGFTVLYSTAPPTNSYVNYTILP